jgi:3-oxoacyl-[acyl-carrier protein] reductase
MSDLRGRVAVVTGGAKGIGLGIAKRLEILGAKVAIFDRDADAIAQSGLHGFNVDVSDSSAVAVAFEQVREWAGETQLLVNNAGIVRDMRFSRIEESDWDAVIDTNLKSMFLCCKAVLPGMVESGFGRIVNMSARAWLGSAGQASYSAAKGGAISLTRSLALEFASKGITVNAVAPGIIDTPLFRNFKPEVQEKLQKSVPVQRIGQVDDVATAVEFFLQPAASYLTGQTLYVCGGRSLSSPSV